MNYLLRRKIIFLAVSIFIFSTMNVAAQEARLYRYIDEKGVKVISSTIPSKYVKRGYDIISVDGRLIESVAPELSGEEKIKLLRVQKEKERVAAWDEELLKRYSHPDDIKEAKKRKLQQNMNSIGIITRNIEKIVEEIDRYQSLAAADEREGREVSEDTLQSIELLKRERLVELKEVADREEERQSIIDSYNRDVERFKIIRPRLQ